MVDSSLAKFDKIAAGCGCHVLTSRDIPIIEGEGPPEFGDNLILITDKQVGSQQFLWALFWPGSQIHAGLARLVAIRLG